MMIMIYGLQRAVARVAAKAAEKRKAEGRGSSAEKDDEETEEKWDGVEPMEVLEGGNAEGGAKNGVDSKANEDEVFEELEQFSDETPANLR